MEQKIFAYKSRFSYWIFLPAIVLLCVALYCYQYNANIIYKGKNIITFPYSFYYTGILGFLFLMYAIYKLRAHYVAIQHGSSIKVSENCLVFPYKKSNMSIDFKEITKLYIKNSSDDGEALIIYSHNGKKSYAFFHDFFASTDQYVAFKAHLEKSINETFLTP